MATADEIRDRESLIEWVQWRSSHDGVVVSQRAACRVLPLYGRAMREHWARDKDVTLLPLLRLNLTGVATGRANPLARLPSPPPDSGAVRFLCDAARTGGEERLAMIPGATLQAADVAFGARTDAIKLVGDVASVVEVTARAADDGARIWEQMRADARTLEQEGDLSSAPLWSIPEPDWFSRADAEMRAIWSEDRPEHWSFWLRWWEGVLSGRQVDWALQEKVALIPDAIWQQGPEAVAEAIREIEGDDALDGGTEPPSMHRALERNRSVVLLQLDALRAFVVNEIDRLRGPNSYSRSEYEQQQARIEKLNRIVEAITLMHEAMEAESSGSTALTVIGTQLPVVMEAADESVEIGGEPQVSEVIATMSITIKHLTDSGTPGNTATAIAFAEFCWRKIKNWRRS